jgi:hypothetical protein
MGMVKPVSSLGLLAPILAIASGINHAAQAADLSQDVTLRQLYTDLQDSVCRNDWEGALAAVGPLTVTPDLPAPYQEQLISFRHQLEEWRATDVQLVNVPGCGGTIVTTSRSPGSSYSWSASSSSSSSTSGEMRNTRIQQLYSSLQTAMCGNDWDSALAAIDPLIGAAELTPNYREYLVSLRRQLENWRAAETVFANTASCRQSNIAELPTEPTESFVSNLPSSPQPAAVATSDASLLLAQRNDE